MGTATVANDERRQRRDRAGGDRAGGDSRRPADDSTAGTASMTPVEARMLRVLSDGDAHTPAELHRCLDDDLGPVRNVRAHLTSIRRKLRKSRRGVRCEILGGVVYYRLVALTQARHRRRRRPPGAI